MTSEIVMYILVNADIRPLMKNKGKIAAQVAHSACKVIKAITTTKNHQHPNYRFFLEWDAKSYPKIVLKAPESLMKQLMTKYTNICQWTRDEGRTAGVPKGSLTTIAFTPLPKDQAPPEIKTLNLL